MVLAKIIDGLTFVLGETRRGEDGGLVGCWLLCLFYILILFFKNFKGNVKQGH